MDNSPSTIAPWLLRNLLVSAFTLAHTPLLYFSHNFNLIRLLRNFLVSCFIFFLDLLHYFFSSLTPPSAAVRIGNFSPPAVLGVGSSGVSRALSQLLLIMSDIPVSSRKYEVVRSLIDRLIDENLAGGNLALREVNCAVLSSAFSRAMLQVESGVEESRRFGDEGGGDEEKKESYVASYVLKGIGYFGRAALRKGEGGRTGRSAEKAAAELMWLVEKMKASGCVGEAVCRWAAAEKLARIAFLAEPRLQGSLVKVSAFLINQARELEEEEDDAITDSLSEQQNQLKNVRMKLLSSWLPLLCRANNGIDAPILSSTERAELERTLENMIPTLDEQDQELVLALWLHHFSHCPASDWPNLRAAYTRWYGVSRASLLSATERTTRAAVQVR